MNFQKTFFVIALSISFLFLISLSSWSGKESRDVKADYLNPQLPVEQRVANLLSRMTIEEKVAQTVCIWDRSGAFFDEDGNLTDEAKEILKHGLGQFARPSVNRTPMESAIITNTLQKYVIENTRLGIPIIFHEEGLHGHMAPGGTSFPQAIALASTWDPDLVEEIFTAVAAEIRARGSHQALTPVLGIAREPRWGRTEETYGEDPYLVSRMGVACVKGFQGKGPNIDKQHVIATPKHFAVHSQPEGGQNCAPCNFSERIIREMFLPPFEAVVTEAGAMSIMPSYNEIDGIPLHANKKLLQSILRNEWGFQGFVVSDYRGISKLQIQHHIVSNKADAAKKALEAGVDIELPQIDCYKTLIQQVKDGKVSKVDLDKAVSRILRAKFLLSLFEDPYADPDYAKRITNSKEHRELALKTARKAIILLKNEGNLLPLDRKKIKSMAVIGPNADICHLGGYSDKPDYTVSILQGIKEKVGSDIKVLFSKGCKITKSEKIRGVNEVELSDPIEDAKRIAEAVKVAEKCDVAIIAVGGNEQTCREGYNEQRRGDRASLDMLGQQTELVRAIVETGTPTVVFLINGRPLSINYIAENVPTVFEGWYLGQETGTAVADVLFGNYNPGGKLPITFPRSVGILPAYYNKKPSVDRSFLFTNKEPLFPFGHGLSYTTFIYENLNVSPNRIRPPGKAVVSVDITNTGRITGDEVIQMYIRDVVSSVTRPVKELKDFKRITLKPGETKTVNFTIIPDKLSFLDENMNNVVEPGMFDIMVGSSSTDVMTVSFEVVD